MAIVTTRECADDYCTGCEPGCTLEWVEVPDDVPESRRAMFAYLSGIGTKEWRADMRALYEEAHGKHTGRYDDCALCEIEDVKAAINWKSTFLEPLASPRAKRFRNTGNKHKKPNDMVTIYTPR